MIRMETKQSKATEKQRARLMEYGYADKDIDRIDVRSAQTAIIKAAAILKRQNNAEVANSSSMANPQMSHASTTNDDMPKTEAKAAKPKADDVKAHNAKRQESVDEPAHPEEVRKVSIRSPTGSVGANPTPALKATKPTEELHNETTNRYLLHYIGVALYTDESFKEEARQVGVNRALPPNRLSNMKWGDPILLGRWSPLAKDDAAGKVIIDKAGHDKQVLGTARLLGYTNVHGINFDCQNREEFITKLTSQLDVTSISEGGGTVKRKCGSYSLGATYYVKNELADIVEKATNLADAMQLKVKVFFNGSLVDLPNGAQVSISPVAFATGGIYVNLSAPLEKAIKPEQRIAFLGNYERKKYLLKEDKQNNT